MGLFFNNLILGVSFIDFTGLVASFPNLFFRKYKVYLVMLKSLMIDLAEIEQR